MKKTFGKFDIPKIKKIKECQLRRASDVEKGKIEIRPTIPFVPESTVDLDRTDKNKNEFISVTCRYRPSVGDSKKKMCN